LGKKEILLIFHYFSTGWLERLKGERSAADLHALHYYSFIHSYTQHPINHRRETIPRALSSFRPFKIPSAITSFTTPKTVSLPYGSTFPVTKKKENVDPSFREVRPVGKRSINTVRMRNGWDREGLK
jgi:hypothetical protein